VSNLSQQQFTHTAKAKDGSWSGSVTPMGASSAAHAKAIIEQGGKYEVTTGKGEDNRFSGGSFGPTQISGKGRSGTDSMDRM
jgi:hypothetical protein